MAKVFSLHEIELRPGVDPAEFEQVFAAEVAPAPTPRGFKASLVKGDRGARAGKIHLLLEMDEETRTRYFPIPDEFSDELRRFMEQHPDTAAAWDKMNALRAGPDTYNDYVVVAE